MSKNDKARSEVSETLINNNTSEKLLGLHIHKKLNFDEHVKNICEKVNSKVRALTRDTPYMDIGKEKLQLHAFFNAQFNMDALQSFQE